MSRSTEFNAICSRSKPDRPFYLPTARHYHCGVLPVMPLYEANRSGDDIHINFSLEQMDSISVGGTGSSLGDPYTLRVPSSQTFIHDFTFAVWADQTDQKLRNHFDILKDGDDLLTPDYITTLSPTEKAVVEFATVRQSQLTTLVTSFDRKTVKYTRALKARSSNECRITFLVVVACSDSVYTNMELTQSEVDELCFRHRVAMELASMLSKQGLVFEGYGDEPSLKREAKALFESMRVDWKELEANFPQMTEEMYKSWLEKPDLNYIKELMDTMMMDSIHQIRAETKIYEVPHAELLQEKTQHLREKIHEFSEMIDQSAERTESRHKSTIPFPAWVPKVLKYSDGSLTKIRNLPGMATPSTTEGRMWAEVLHSVGSGEVEIDKEDMQAEYDHAMEFVVEDEKERKNKRKKYRRVAVKLTKEEEIDLACKGFGGKAHKFHPRVKEARKLSKQTFKLSTDTNDIERFVQQDESVFKTEHRQSLFSEFAEAFKNIEEAHAMHGVNETQNLWTQRSKAFYESPLGVWLTMVTAIAIELAASVRQNCKAKQVLIKKLRMFDVFIIIKPTNSTSHIFFTLAISKNSLQCLLSDSEVFKSFHKSGNWYYTELHSFKIPKLTNMTRAMSCIHNLYWFFRDFHGVNFFHPLTLEDSAGLKEAERMTRASMLVFFEDKARTEEIITLSRYVFMEGFVALPAAPNPGKMIKKLPKIFRTKLQIWLANRLFLAMLRITKNPFVAHSVDGKAKWTNMFNMFTGAPVESPKRLISLFYLGYLKNKEEGPDRNGNSQLYEKIIEEEDKFSGRREFLGLRDPPIGDVKTHEYSPSLIKAMSQIGVSILERDYGQNVMERVEDDIDTAISSISLNDMATLKASSSFGPELYKTVHEKPYHRRKVATALMPMVKDKKTHLHHVLTECLEKVEGKGGIHACLFKKQQHGGIREIYVLGIEERVVQLTYETIMKQVCKFFKSETLMNPKQKHIIPSNHGYIASKVCNGIVFTTCSSDDQSRWNQTQHVTKFALMAVNILPKKYHAFILRASALFMRKRIMIDPALLKIMRSITDLKTGSVIFQRMHSAYHGNSEERWLKRGDSYITTETGMMQGILHYTSSLMHTLFLEFYRDWSLKRMAIECLEKETKAHMDILQSSDDSSVLLSFPANVREYTLNCRFFALVLFEFKKKLGRYIGIEASPKSTSGTPFVVEFNSEFFFHNNHYRPEIRWIAAADLVCEHETLASRQEEMSNNLTAVLEGGSSLSLTAFCQIGQAVLHYLLLGMTTTGLFYNFCVGVRSCRDPSLGFFLMDHPFAAGAVGFKYNLWTACKKTNLGRHYSALLQLVDKTEKEVAKEDRPTKFASLETTRTGTFTGAVGVQWGDRSKWLAEIEKMGLPEDYLEVTDARPEVLYERATTAEEVKLKVAEKMHSPGVTESLSSGNSVNRVIAASVYCLSQRVMTNTSEWLDTREGKPEKHSLLFHIRRASLLVEDTQTKLNPEQERLLFPLSEEYDRIRNNLKDLTSVSAQRIIDSRPIIQTRISIVETVKFLRCSPVDLVSDMWFGTTKVNMSRQALNEEWEQLTQILPWLCTSAAMTLERSPFNHHCQLRNFLSRMSPRGRMIHIVGAPIKRASGMSNLMTAIRDNFFPGYKLTDSFDQYSKEKADKAALLKHYMYMALTSPLKDEEIKSTVKEILIKCPTVGYSQGMKKSKLTNLAILQEWVQDGDDSRALRNIEASGSGVVGGYTRKQFSRIVDGVVTYHGDGEWCGSVEGVRVEVHVGMGPESGLTNFTQVTIDREMDAGDLIRFLKQWAAEHNVRNDEPGHMTLKPQIAGSRLYWLHKFKLTSGPVEKSIPIYYTRRKVYRSAPLPTSDPLRLHIRRRTINLQAKDGSYTTNVLSYTATDAEASDVVAQRIREDIDAADARGVDPDMSFLAREPSRSWFSMRRLNPQTVTSLLKATYDPNVREERVRLDKTKTKSLFRELTENSLRRAGVGLSDLGSLARLKDEDWDRPEATTKKAAPVDLSHLMCMVMDFDDELVAGPPILTWDDVKPQTQEAEEEEAYNPLEDYIESDVMGREEFEAFGAGRIKQDYSARFYEHPLLDAEIEGILRRFPAREVTVYLREKIALQSRKQDVERLNQLLGIPDKDVNYIEEEVEVGPAVMDVENLG
nr:MAG: RNA-dependent RNA polymerase [Dabieshan tick virus]